MPYIPPNPNGPAPTDESSPFVLPALTVGGTVRVTPALNYDFFTNTTNGWLDVLAYGGFSCTIVSSAGLSAGSLIFEATNDATNGVGTVMKNVEETNSLVYNRTTANFSVSSSTTRQFHSPLTMRYIRLRVFTAYTTGSITATAVFQQAAPFMTSLLGAFSLAPPAGTNTLGNVTLAYSTSNIGVFALASTNTSTDVSSTTIATSTLSSQIALNNNAGVSAVFCVQVTAISGTTQLDVVIQESMDGVNYMDMYHFERITATTTTVTPLLRLTGHYLRYNMVISGTATSATLAILRLDRSVAGANYRQYYDRSMTPSLNSATAAYFVESANQIFFAINSNTVSGTPCTVSLQASHDKINWWQVGSLPTSNGTVQTILGGLFGKWIRGSVTTAGDASQTIDYVCFGASARS